MSDKKYLQQAKQLIQQKKYDQARKILEQMPLGGMVRPALSLAGWGVCQRGRGSYQANTPVAVYISPSKLITIA